MGGVYYAYETWKRRMNINNKKEKKTVRIYNEFQLNQFKFYRDIVLVKTCVRFDRLIYNGAYSVKFRPLSILMHIYRSA